jgi:hypothetical protein
VQEVLRCHQNTENNTALKRTHINIFRRRETKKCISPKNINSKYTNPKQIFIYEDKYKKIKVGLQVKIADNKI